MMIMMTIIGGMGLLSRPSNASTCHVGGTLSIMMITMLSQNCFYLLHVYVVYIFTPHTYVGGGNISVLKGYDGAGA